jgi:TIR domain-containing protein/pentapeptide repeat protein
MANQEYLDILNQGVEIWNRWRDNNANVRPDLTGYPLAGTDLSRINLSRVNLSAADLKEANLSEANLRAARLYSTHLYGADLRGADLREANFYRADLRKAYVGYTIFGNVNLSVAHGLKTVNHDAPSTVGIDTIIRSHGKIPEIFLRKAGVPQSIIDQIPALIGSLNLIDYYSCFISYSSKDQDFAERLYADLQSKGVRCWFAPEDMDIGDKIRPRIEESIRLYDKLLLVLSEHSITSNWVAYEVERALNKEPEGVPNVLYPIRLDDTVLQSKAGWAEDIRRTRHIGDFTHWKNHDDYKKAFNRLLHALKTKVQKAEGR